MRRNVRKIGILATICSFCMILVCGVCSLFTNNTYKVSATTPTTGAHTVTEVCLHQGAISGNGFFCYFMENSTVLKQDLGTGLTEDNNTYLKNFANQLFFTGNKFENSGVGGRLNTQGALQNWFIEKTNGSTSTAVAVGDYFLIPQGTTYATSQVTFTFGKNFKILYTGSTTCPQTSDGVTCAGSGKCGHGYHVFSWASNSIQQISLNAGSGQNFFYSIFWGPGALESGIAAKETEDTNTFLRAFTDQLQLNGQSFTEAGLITAQGNVNMCFQKADMSNFKEGDTLYIPYGTKFVTNATAWVFGYNFKIVASTKACTDITNCQTALGNHTSQYCLSGKYHVYRWANGAAEPEVGTPNLNTYADNTGVQISAKSNTNGTVGIMPYFYNTQGYAISFDLLDCYGAGFGLVIGTKTSIQAFNTSGYQYLLFKGDGTTENSLGYTGTFKYSVGHTYKFAVEGNKVNLYEKGVLDSDSAYTQVASANFSLGSWDSIGILAKSDAERSTTVVLDNIAIYNQSGTAVWASNCDGALPGLTIGNSNGKGSLGVYNSIMYKVVFVNENGQQLSTQNVCANGKATVPTSSITPIEGYEFTGWSDDYSVITSDVVIYPVYESTTKIFPVAPEMTDNNVFIGYKLISKTDSSVLPTLYQPGDTYESSLYTYEAVTLEMYMEKGASARLSEVDGISGIRYTVNVNKAQLQSIKDTFGVTLNLGLRVRVVNAQDQISKTESTFNAITDVLGASQTGNVRESGNYLVYSVTYVMHDEFIANEKANEYKWLGDGFIEVVNGENTTKSYAVQNDNARSYRYLIDYYLNQSWTTEATETNVYKITHTLSDGTTKQDRYYSFYDLTYKVLLAEAERADVEVKDNQ